MRTRVIRSTAPTVLTALVVSAILAATAGARPASAQVPDSFTNLEVFPPDIPHDQLLAAMRGFANALGVHCEFCHVMGPDDSFRGARFDLDDKPTKDRARFMMHMVHRLNTEILPDLPHQEGPTLPVRCKTCHRGLEKPYLLDQELHRVLEKDGLDAALARYRELRTTMMEAGAYDFREGALTDAAMGLAGEGRTDAAVAFLKLNGEYHPESASIPFELGQVYERMGRTSDAIASYRTVLQRDPENRRAKERLEALGGG